MQLQVNGHSSYCYSGGKPFDAAKPSLLFIHGVLNDHSVWILQSRYFANHGWNVLALDLPGHGRSAGAAPQTVQQAAAFVLALMDAAGLEQAALVGHSFGSLIALEAAGDAPQRVTRLALLGTAFPMRVSPALLETSKNDPMRAIEMTTVYSHGSMAPPPSALGPGTWVRGTSRALMRRLLAGNPKVNLLHTGFNACNSYDNGLVQIRKVRCPIRFVLGLGDSMTQPQAAQPLIDALPAGADVVRVDGGHQMMTEAPEQVLAALADFLKLPTP
jgi:pimeloyl-ACP methyl ester carboxylesterase